MMMVTIKKGTEHTEEFQPKPDQSRLLTDEEDGVSPYVSEDFQEAYEESILKPICKAQRDLTAEIKDAHYSKRINTILDHVNKEHSARIEALIEWLERHKKHYQPSNWGTEYYISHEDLTKLKATHTSKKEKK